MSTATEISRLTDARNTIRDKMIELGEIASANYVSECITDVTEELKEAECYYLNKKIRDYDISDIMDEQTKFSKDKCKEICKVIKEIFN